MNRSNRQSSIVNRQYPARFRVGQVLIEFALAAAGIVAIAFVIARTGQWLNESMVQRNANFQASRVPAGQSPTLVRVDPPSPIHLIGPGAGRSGGLGPQPPGPPPPTCRDGDDKLREAARKRNEANAMIAANEQWRVRNPQKGTKNQEDISAHHARAKRLISLANSLLTHKEEVDRLNREIPGFEQLIRDSYAANVALLQDFMQAAGLADAEELIDAWQEVDDRLKFLNGRIAEYNTQIGKLNKVTSTYIAPKLTEINSLLNRDADGPDGARYEPPTGITQRISQINRLLQTDADGSGPLTVGINQRITDIQDRQAEIPGELIACGVDVACAEALIDEADALRLELEGDPSADPPIDGWLDIKADLEYERDVEPHVVAGVDIPPLAMTVPDTAVTDLPGLTILDAPVAGLVGQKAQLEAIRTALIDYWTDEINPRVQDLIKERKPFMDEQNVLSTINGRQSSIQSREQRKQDIKNQWCNFRDGDLVVKDYVRSAGADCASASGLDCSVTAAPLALTHGNVTGWRSTMDPLSTNPDSLAPGSGHLACMAHKVKEAADTEFQEANDLVEGSLPADSETIQGLLDEAEELERQAREVCSSM